MTSATADPTRPGHATHVALWLPLALLCAVLLGSASGFDLVNRAHAATAGGDVEIEGTVDKDVQIDSTGCTGAALAIGSIAPGDPMTSTASDCVIGFSSNNSALGASLTVQEDPVAGAGFAMKCSGGSCGTDQLDDFAAADWNGQTGSKFGIRLLAAAGAATASWALEPQIHNVAAPSTACSTASVAAGTCSFRFAAAASTTDVPGTYQALVQFTAQAN